MSLFQQIASIRPTLIGQLSLSDKEKLQQVVLENNRLLKVKKSTEEYLDKQEALLSNNKEFGFAGFFKEYQDKSIGAVDWAIHTNIDEFAKYLNKKYFFNTRFSTDNLSGIGILSDGEPILQKYFEVGKIASLRENGIKEIKETFLSKITSRWHKPKLQKDSIALPYYYYSEYSSWRKREEFTSDNDSKINTLMRVLNLFENDNFDIAADIASKFDWIRYGEEVYHEEQFFGQSKKISSVIFMKTGNKIKITFQKPEYAKEFWEYFEMEKAILN